MRIPLLFTCVAAFVFITNAEQVAFDIPANHEKSPMLDSMFRASDTLDKKVNKIELRLIKVKTIRNGNLNAKVQYLDQQYKKKVLDTAAILNYYRAAQAYYQSCENYFTELLTVLQGSDVVRCNNMLRAVRTAKGVVMETIMKFEPSETPTIQKSKLKLDLGE
jgi:hypothetical protein